MISIQTNVDSLIAQQNLNLDNQFQSSTIQQLTSGYRINKSGDDAAGLAIANGLNSQISQLTQGVNNANNGLSQLQIVDGGLSNISTILNRLQTLATESASSAFTGNRVTLNNEYTGLLAEVTRQATNINLNVGGSFNGALSVFIGGGSNATNSSVAVDLSGTKNAVDATSLGLTGTNVLNGGVSFGNNTQRLDATGATFLQGSAAASQSFTFNLATSTGSQTVIAKVQGSAAGISESDVLTQLNGQLNQYGISAGLSNAGTLQFTGATSFNVTDGGAAGAGVVTNSSLTTGSFEADGQTTYGAPATATDVLNVVVNGVNNAISLDDVSTGDTLQHALATINAAGVGNGFTAVANSAGTGINILANGAHSLSVTEADGASGEGVFGAATQTPTAATILTTKNIASNTSNYTLEGAAAYTAPLAANTETLTIQTGSKSISVILNATNAGSATSAAATINAATAAAGVNAILNAAGTGIEFQSANSFSLNSADTVTSTGAVAANKAGVFAAPGAGVSTTYASATVPTNGTTNNADSAITAINSAIAQLGLTQGVVGAGENTLNYAINLAQSQITNFSSAASNIKDADVATQAANLSKSQVLTQTAVAALAQANSEPQAILKLLQ